jgi:hypothetical protein
LACHVDVTNGVERHKALRARLVPTRSYRRRQRLPEDSALPAQADVADPATPADVFRVPLDRD